MRALHNLMKMKFDPTRSALQGVNISRGYSEDLVQLVVTDGHILHKKEVKCPVTYEFLGKFENFNFTVLNTDKNKTAFKLYKENDMALVWELNSDDSIKYNHIPVDISYATYVRWQQVMPLPSPNTTRIKFNYKLLKKLMDMVGDNKATSCIELSIYGDKNPILIKTSKTNDTMLLMPLLK